MIDYYECWFNSSDFFGSLFVKSVNEFPENSPISTIANHHRTWLLDKFKSVLGSDEKAINLLVLLDGATVHEKLYRDKTSIKSIKDILNKAMYYGNI